MRSSVSSQHAGPPKFLTTGHAEDIVLLNEWRLVLRGDGKSPRTIEGYLDSVQTAQRVLVVGRVSPSGRRIG